MSTTGHLSELESLRLQVADLSRALAERDQSMRTQSHHLEEKMQDLREQSHLLRTIIEGTAAETGDEFFASLVNHLTSTLHVQYAVISEVFEGRLTKIRTLAVSAGGTLVDNFEYELAHTPCATALTQTFTCFDRDVQATFPQFQRLADLGAESYCGVPLRTKGGVVIGLLVVMDTKPLQQGDYLQSLLEVLAPRVVAEFERRRVEQERAQALADLHNVIETVPDIMFTLDIQGNMVKWNRRVVDVTGYSPEELLNKPALAFVPPEEQTNTAAAIQRAFTEGYAELDGQLLTKEHHLIPYHWTGALLKNPQGEPIGITGIGRDVSDKKRAEDELKQQRRHLIDAQALAHLGSWYWDVDTGEEQWSDEQFRIFGYEPGAIAVTYDRFLASLHPDDHAPVLAAINDALLGTRPYDVGYRIVRPNGEVRSIHARGDVSRDATGHPLSMAGTALDITERKWAEEQRDRQYRQLQTMYRMTVALTQARAVEELYAEALNGICSALNADRASIHLFDEDGVTRFQASRGLSERYQHAVEGHSPWSREAVNPPPICVPDVAEAPSVEAYRDIFRAEGIRALIFIPLVSSEELLGKFMLYYDTPHQFTDEDISVAHTIVSHVAFMIQRKRAEDEHHRLLVELAQSQKHFERLFHLTPSAIAISTVAEGRFLEVNDALVKLTGYAREELIGRTTLELKLWVDPPERVRAIQEIRQKGSVHNKEGLLRTKSGEHRHVMISAEPMQVEADACLIYIAHDITAWKQAEMTRAQLAAIVESSNDAIIGLSLDGAILSWNRRAEAMFGYGAGDILGQSIAALYPPVCFPEADEFMQRLARGSRGDHFETMNRHRHGHAIAVSVNVAPILDGSGRLIGISHIVRDITERRQALLRLGEQESLLRSILDAEPECVKRVAADGTVLQMNKAGLCFIETDSFEQVFGRSVYDLVAPEFLELYRSMHEAVIQGASQQLEFQIVGLKGTRRWMETHAVPLQNPINNCVEQLAITRDISERKRIEEALRKSEERFALAVEGSTDILWDAHRLLGEPWYAPQTPIWWSPRVRELLGLEESESFETLEQWAVRLHPDDKDRVFGQLAAHIDHQVPYDVEYRLRTNRGDYRWIRGRGRAMWDEQGEPRRMSGSCQDITEHKVDEQLLATEKQSLDMIATGASLQDILVMMCRVFEGLSHGAYHSVLLLDHDGLHLRHGAAPSLPEAYVHAIDGVAIGPTVGSCGTAAFMRRQVIVSDIARDPLWADYRDLALRHGLRACWSTPVLSFDGTVLATFAVYYREPQLPTYAELQLIERAKHIVCIAIERKRAEEALRESEERFRAIVDNSPAQVFLKDTEGRYLQVNRKFEDSFHVANRDLIGKMDEDIFPPEQAAAFRANDRQVLEAGQPIVFEETAPHDDGLRTSIVVKFPLLNAQGESYALCGIVTDITERKRAEQGIREAELRYRTIFKQAGAGVAQIESRTGRFVQVNHQYCEILGLTEDEMLATTVGALTHSNDLERDLESMTRLLSGEIPSFTMEKRYVRKDGSIVWVNLNVSPLWRPGELPVHHIAIVQDITKRKQVEATLHESEERFGKAFRSSPNPIWITAMESGRCIDVNDAYLEFFGYRREEVIGQTTLLLGIWPNPDDRARLIERLKSGGPVRNFEISCRVRTGELRHVLASSDLVEMNGEACLLTVGTDITERKRAEKLLRESEERYARATAAGKVGVWELDVVTGSYHGDPNLKALFGYVDDELSTDPYVWLNLVHSDDRSIAMDHWQRIVNGEAGDYNYELRMLKKDGTIIWTEVRGHAVRDHEGQVTHLFGATVDISERKQAQDALARSERQLRTVLDALPVGVWFTDQSGKPVLSNPAAKQIWSGIKQVGIETAANDAGWWEAIGPSSEFHRWALSQSLTKGVPSLNETLDLECLDGTKKTIHNTTVPVRNEAGAVIGAIVLNEDITALRQAQEALKLTQFSVDHAVEGFLWIGPDARILHVNDAACRMLQYTHDELTTMTLHDIDPNLPPELWSVRWEDVKRTGSMTFESKHWSKTGRVLDTEVTVNYLDYEGREYNCAIMRDIGERKRAEASLRQSEERYRSLVDNAPIGIFVNEAGRFVYANREMQRILKAPSAEQLIGTPVLERIAPEFHTLVKDRIQELTKGQPAPSLDEQFVRLDGSRVDVAVTAIPTSFDGTPMVQVLVLDIMERKRMEEALRQRERDLRVALDERERISQDLHDGILQSLFAVGLALETAKSMMSPRNRKMSGPPLDQAIDQLNRVMREIRNFIAGLGSDLLKGKDLPTALQQMLETLTHQHATRVRLAIEDRATQSLSAEQSLHLLLVIQEAVSNCIRHGRAQEATVSLKMLKQGVRLSIRDNGSGFNPEAARRTGRGLINMAARAQKIGGRFTVFSKINEGTRIVFDLPKEASSVRS